MIPVLDNASMRAADQQTIGELGLPSLVLMEQAAAAVQSTVDELLPPEAMVLVVAGLGNNGGDGLAMARQRQASGGKVEVVVVGEAQKLSPDAEVQLGLAKRFGVTPKHITSLVELDKFHELLNRADGIVDALFGTGLSRPLENLNAAVVEAMNAAGLPVVAVDIPSGLSGDHGNIEGPAVKADVTVTFGALKWAHVLTPAAFLCGDVVVAEIGIPKSIIERLAPGWLIERGDAAGWLPTRAVDAHKGHFGHLLLVAGRFGRAGAAALGASAAVHAGAGLVTVATASPAVLAVQARVAEAMVDPLPTGDDGAVSGEGIEDFLPKATAVAVGPGVGLGEGPRKLLFRILEKWDGPLVLDADALTLLAGKLELLRKRKGPTVLTPHPGELARLLGTSSARIQEDRVASVKRAVELSGATVLLKGFHTLVAQEGEPILINPTGSSGLATGGAGDVLTGIVGAFLAQGLPGKEAAALSAFLHGRAADLAQKRFSGAVPASVVARLFSKAEAELRGKSGA